MKDLPPHGLGIDTGGTCTDAVLVALASGAVVASAKTATTHHDLSLGIRTAAELALERADVSPRSVTRIALSTTLATNAVVEDKGGSVGLLMIGPTTATRFELPAARVAYLEGGHKWSGEEEDPLDLADLTAILEQWRGEVDAYAACSALSVRNPAHEMVAAKAASLIDPDRPMFCSHQASGDYGMKERASTAVLNASLMPLMERFLDGVERSLASLELGGSARLVCGDARVIDMEQARLHATSTAASGPASSAYFGALVGEVERAVVVDVGGTTTDVALVLDGSPEISDKGSRVGGWQTLIPAVETFTIALGGDSWVVPHPSNIELRQRRVTPLAMKSGWQADLSAWADSEMAPRYVALTARAEAVERGDDPVVDTLRERGPLTTAELADALEGPEARIERRVTELADGGFISEYGFTPTDALHVLGELTLGSAEAAARGAEVLAGRAGLSVQELCERVLSQAAEAIETAIEGHIILRELGFSVGNFLSVRRDSALLEVNIKLKVPIVGVGAASRYLLPPVAERLGVDLQLPEHFAVGNALGAILIALRG